MDTVGESDDKSLKQVVGGQVGRQGGGRRGGEEERVAHPGEQHVLTDIQRGPRIFSWRSPKMASSGAKKVRNISSRIFRGVQKWLQTKQNGQENILTEAKNFVG